MAAGARRTRVERHGTTPGRHSHYIVKLCYNMNMITSHTQTRSTPETWTHPERPIRHRGVSTLVWIACLLWVQSMPRPMEASPLQLESRILVQVKGRVRRPGVYTLARGSRGFEAIQKAGGPLGDADLGTVALAEELSDGQALTVEKHPGEETRKRSDARGRKGRRPATRGRGRSIHRQSSATPHTTRALKISLNTATSAQLDTLPGIGPHLASQIIDLRERQHGFRSFDDLAQVRGLGPRRIERLRPMLEL